MRQFNKTYTSPTDIAYRYNVFQTNVRKIAELNRMSTSAQYGINQFTDMTTEEFANYPCGGLLSRFPSHKSVSPMPAYDPSALPASFDWTTKGAVTPIKNQEQCGSCWAFSTIGMLEGAWFLSGKSLTGLAEQQLVDCSTQDYGCGGGWPFWALQDMLGSTYSGKIDTEGSYPYTAEDGTCAFASGTVGADYVNYTSYCTEQTAACAETDMQNLLVNVGPLSACLDANPMQSYTGGVDNPPDCTASQIDHCITIVGYGTDPTSGLAYWRIKNSWGASWGESGFYRLIRGIGACGINQVITMATI
jgi:C1A family cysteine protease